MLSIYTNLDKNINFSEIINFKKNTRERMNFVSSFCDEIVKILIYPKYSYEESTVKSDLRIQNAIVPRKQYKYIHFFRCLMLFLMQTVTSNSRKWRLANCTASSAVRSRHCKSWLKSHFLSLTQLKTEL